MSTLKYPTHTLSEGKVDEYYHYVLLIFDCLYCDFSQEVVVKKMRRQVQLDRESFSKELLIELLMRWDINTQRLRSSSMDDKPVSSSARHP